MTSVPLTIAGLVRSRRRCEDKSLLVCDAERLSYADADARSASLAARLITLGVGKGTHVGLLYARRDGQSRCRSAPRDAHRRLRLTPRSVP